MGSLTAQQRLTVLLELLGGPNYTRQMKAASASTATLGKTTKATGEEMLVGSHRTFLMNQALYTLRRYSFYATTALIAGGLAVGKLGYNYLAAMQTARVALKPVIKDHKVLNGYLTQLFRISKYSPFVITDLAKGFQQLVIGTRGAGIALPTIMKTIQSITDLQSVTGKVGPGSLNKVTTALTHMAFAGRLTGRIVNQLYQNGIPIFDILNKKLHVTGDQLKNISGLGIPAGDVLKAINQYVSGNKAFSGAALRISLKTLPGLLQVLRDSVSQLSGAFIGKGYTGFQNWLFNIVKPGGPLDKISSIGVKKGGGAAIIAISRSLTGSSGLGRGFLLLVDITKQFARVVAKVMVPALVIALHTLILFWPVLFLVDKLFKFAADHAKIFKWVLSILAAEFVIAHARLVLFGLGMKAFGFFTFGSVGGIKSMISWLNRLRTGELTLMQVRIGLMILKLKELRAAMVGVGWLSALGAVARSAGPVGVILGAGVYGYSKINTHSSGQYAPGGTLTHHNGDGNKYLYTRFSANRGPNRPQQASIDPSGDLVIHNHVHLDGKEIANSVDKVKAAKRARK